MFPIWFACRTCRGSFKKLNEFLQHKKQFHLEEFQNTECIIFEERGILSNEQIGAFSPTTPKLEEEYLHHDHVDPPIKVKVENENYLGRSDPEVQCHTDQTVEFVYKIEHKSVDQDFEDNLDDSKSKPATNLDSDCDCQPLLKTASIPQNSITKVRSVKVKLQNLEENIDFKNTKNVSAPKLNASSKNKSDLITNINLPQSQHNPFVLVRRLTPQEIENKQNNSASKPHFVVSPSSTKTSEKRKNSFECKLCLEKFNSDSKLTVHLDSCAVTHPDRHRFCVPCNKKFYKNNNLLKHVSSCHATKANDCNSNKLKQCVHCPMTFLYESQLIRHSETHADGKRKPCRKFSKPFKCQDCGKLFFYKFSLNENLTPQKFKCLTPNCKGLFEVKGEVRDLHPTIHRYAPKWKCPEIKCGKKFLLESHVKSHLYTHSNRRSFMCPKGNCQKTFKSQDSLRYHIKSHNETQQFHCPNPKCKKSCKTKQRLRDHMVVHSISRPFKCPEKDCVGRYKTKCNLMNHLKAHVTQSCNVLSTSDSSSRLVNNTDAETSGSWQGAQDAVKSKLVRFKCTKPDCKRQFKRYSELKIHASTHYDSLRIKCPFVDCEKSYTCKGSLRHHLFTHSGTKLRKCPQVDCQKSFKSNTDLLQHLKTHMGAILFKCLEADCGKRFKYKINLQKHRITHSKN